MGGLNLTPMLLKLFPILSWMPIPAIVRSIRAQEKLRTLVRRIVDLKSFSLVCWVGVGVVGVGVDS